ncbi:MAG: N-6 DNA methylase [Chloroflexi bacterium]|nr:N-6 DNA methylase [Chloroflexota bacterium]
MQLRGRTSGFVRTEGGLLSADLLERVRALDRKLPGLDEASYGLAKNERFGDAIARTWNKLTGAWATFQDELPNVPPSDPATTTTRERFLLPLFEELGYGRLSPTKSIEIDGKAYPVSHGYESVPLHLVGANVPIDHRSKGVAGAAGQSPHGLVQELLNRSPERLWGIVTNGRTLRILRDNASLVRQAYVEFDLEAIMAGEAYADFALLWHLAHRTRLEPRVADGAEEGSKPTQAGCYLERWSKVAEETGARARDRLRDGVQEAIEALGSGFLAHPANAALKTALQNGELATQDYYRELLRLVYRLILLFVAEDRDLLLDPKAGPAIRDRYARFYSTARLRHLAERRKGSRHADLYAGLRVVIGALGSDDGALGIGLPPLGGFLFGPEACPHLDGAELANADLLEAIRKLATIEERNVLRTVDYRNLGAEELGSIYESLLELHPEIDTAAGVFKLTIAAGHERKTTGSYYTPSSLISVLLDSALDPVLAEIADKPTKEEAERAILEMSVVDPAAGSGHFLVAAAHRIAKRLAQVRTEDEEPAPTAITTALRDVIGHCLYAVDINPMAVELCKVSLWLEALEPGKPLTFLDAHIKCGNSLLGTTPELIAQGIPDAAYDPIEGDDKAAARSLRDRNALERAGQLTFGERPITFDLSPLAAGSADLDRMPDDNPPQLATKAAHLERLMSSPELLGTRAAADVWCAAILMPKSNRGDVPTTSTLRQTVRDRLPPSGVAGAVAGLVAEFAFFHWPLEFPAVTARGGFDVVLGNPPWAALSPDRREFFAQYDPGIRAQGKDGQDEIIVGLLADPQIGLEWNLYRRRLFGLVHFLKNAGRYTMYASGNLGKGDFNIYRPFVELALRATRVGGRASQVVPAGLYNGANTSAIRKYLFDDCVLERVLGFDNQQHQWFDVSVNSVCVYVASPGGRTRELDAAFAIASPEEAATLKVRLIRMDADEVRREAPRTYALSEIANVMESRIARKMQSAWPALGEITAGPPHRHYLAEVHMGNDRSRFNSQSGLPVFEGRMIDRYDYRAKTYREGHGNSSRWDAREFGDSDKAIVPQWYIRPELVPEKLGDRPTHYRVGYADIADPRTARSVVATMIPPGAVCGHAVPTILFSPEESWAFPGFLGVANSFAFDFLARTRLNAKHLNFTILDGLPFPRLRPGDPRLEAMAPLVVRLVSTGAEMRGFWNQMAQYGWVKPVADGIPPGLVEPLDRAEAEALIDAIVARDLFELTREEYEYVLDSFQGVQNEEMRRMGEFRSKRLALEHYDGPRVTARAMTAVADRS